MSFVGDFLPIYQRLTALLRDPNMPVTILTRSRVVAAPARDQRYNILDKKLKGFGVRIEPNGRKFWFLQTTKNGRRYYRSLGAFPAVPIDTAHQTARNLLAQIKCEGSANPTTRAVKIFAHVADSFPGWVIEVELS